MKKLSVDNKKELQQQKQKDAKLSSALRKNLMRRKTSHNFSKISIQNSDKIEAKIS